MNENLPNIIVVDRDPLAFQTAMDWQLQFSKHFSADSIAPFTFEPKLAPFSKLLASVPDHSIDLLLLDLGVSSMQLDDPSRGFSFKRSGPLDMRMSQPAALHAAENSKKHEFGSATEESPSALVVVNTLSKDNLADIFFKFGQEKYANWIADAIVKSRQICPIETTDQLAKIVEDVFSEMNMAKKLLKPKQYSSGNLMHTEPHPLSPSKLLKASYSIHPATKCFQALRIYVNDEIGELERALALLDQKMKPNGVFVCISFHYLEDLLVKKFFKSYQKNWLQYTKHPIEPSVREIHANMRSRSAMLRIGRKLT